jgi:Tfp pilus assembly protein FimT
VIRTDSHHDHALASSSSAGIRAYTIIELLLIVVIMGIVASSAIPVMNQSVQARQGASRDEVVRLLEFARGRAIAGGVPAGVVVDTGNGTLSLVPLDSGGAITNIVDPIDGQSKQTNLGSEYAGVLISSMVNGDGNSGNGTIWFDFQAEPHTRNEVTGVFDAVFSQNATISLSTGTQIVVYAGSGMVEEQ